MPQGESAEDHVVLGTTFIRLNDLENAHRQFEMAVALDEGHAEARFHLANVLSGRGDVAGAVIHYERALAINPDNAEAHQNLGLALQRLGQFEPPSPTTRPRWRPRRSPPSFTSAWATPVGILVDMITPSRTMRRHSRSIPA